MDIICCKQCQKPLNSFKVKVKAKFCNRDCMAKNMIKSPREVKCKNCNKPFYFSLDRILQKNSVLKNVVVCINVKIQNG